MKIEKYTQLNHRSSIDLFSDVRHNIIKKQQDYYFVAKIFDMKESLLKTEIEKV